MLFVSAFFQAQKTYFVNGCTTFKYADLKPGKKIHPSWFGGDTENGVFGDFNLKASVIPMEMFLKLTEEERAVLCERK